MDHVGVVVVRVHVEEGKDLRDFFGGFDEVVEVSGVWRVTRESHDRVTYRQTASFNPTNPMSSASSIIANSASSVVFRLNGHKVCFACKCSDSQARLIACGG